MNIPQYNRDGSLTVLFQTNTEKNSLSISLEECLGDSRRLKDPDEVMFLTFDRTQVQNFQLVIAVSFHIIYRLWCLSSIPVARVRNSGIPY